MFHIETSPRIRRASSLTLSILIMSGLILTMENRALAQDSNDVDKIDAISKRLEALEKQIEGLKRENAELKKKFGEKEKPTAALAAEAETPAAEAPKAAAAQGENKPQPKESRIEFGGEIRLRPEVRDRNLDPFFTGVDSFIGQRVRLHAKAKLSNDLTRFVEIQDSRSWGAEFSTTNSIRGVDLHQAYIQADHVLTSDLSLKIGRQELSYGNERLVGAFDWDFVGRSFDAIKAVYAKKSWSADIFAARVVYGFAGFGPAPGNGISQDFSFALAHQDFYGVYLKFLNDNPTQKLEAYGFLLRDNFSSRGEVGERRDSTGIYTVGARHEIRSQGGFYYDGEAAFQTGHRGPDDHRALALAGSVGKYFKSPRKSHFGFEYDFATGDGDFRDGKSREFINLFPNNHIHYGYIDFLGWRNMHDFRLNFGFDPASKLSLDADYHKFLLHKGDGIWSSASGFFLGFDPSGSSGRELGQELDFTLRFPYKEHMNFLAGYSLFLPGRFARLTRTSDLSHFSYIQTRINF
jgi:hypothetical protein